MKNLRVAMAQMNCTVGDFVGNVHRIVAFCERAAKFDADIVMFPELSVCGYPPEDLLLRKSFLDASKKAVDEISSRTAKLPQIVIVGFPEHDGETYNSAAIIYKGKVYDIYRKILLPNYGVFDEKRYFVPGSRIPVYETSSFRFGVNVCEDIWHDYGPTAVQASAGKAEIIININSSPFYAGKYDYRERVVGARASENSVPIAYVNLVGGQDELVFDGQSFAVNASGEIIARAGAFEEELLIVDFNLSNCNDRAGETADTGVSVVKIPFSPIAQKCEILVTIKQRPELIAEVWMALVLGLRDYACKNGFKSVILGLSGGIDSALVATIAADALGAENVHAVFMPTKFTAERSFDDAKKLAQNIGIDFIVIGIEPLFEAYLAHLEPHLGGKEFDITEENIQSRIRGNILMALSNKFGHLVIATGNKSEMSVGYATLYGDMVGGFAVLKDVPKTMVWELARWRNETAKREIIPESIIERPPSAELRENQLDTDSLPPYETLDRILELYIEREMSADEIAEQTGFDVALVRKVARMVDSAEYKRRQAPPGIKVTTRAFGKERRMPITMKRI